METNQSPNIPVHELGGTVFSPAHPVLIFVSGLALMALVLETDSSGITSPELVMKQPRGRPSGDRARAECNLRPRRRGPPTSAEGPSALEGHPGIEDHAMLVQRLDLYDLRRSPDSASTHGHFSRMSRQNGSAVVLNQQRPAGFRAIARFHWTSARRCYLGWCGARS